MKPKRRSKKVLPAAAKTSNIGDAVLKVLVNTKDLDDFIERLDRSFAAFTAEWKRR